MSKKYDLDKLIELQREIIKLSDPLTSEDLAKIGFVLLNLQAVYEFDLSQPQAPRVIHHLAQEMPVILKALQDYLGASTN